MTKAISMSARALRLTPLAACLSIALAAATAGDALAGSSQPGAGAAQPLAAGHGTGASGHYLHFKTANIRSDHRGKNFKSALAEKVGKVRNAVAQRDAQHPHAAHPASVVPVTSCLDDGSTGTLRDVISNAVSGDVIDLSTSGCSSITLQTGAITFNVDDLTIKGSSAAAQKIDGNRTDSIFEHGGYGTLTIENITLTNAAYNGLIATGGAVFSSGNVSVLNATISNSSSYGYFGSGGGVFASGTATISNSVISGNQITSTKYDGTGGGVYGATGLTITNSTISGNSAAVTAANNETYYAYGKGGGVMTVVPATISGSTISGNIADFGGGVAQLVGSNGAPTDPLVVTNSTLSGNNGYGLAGAVLAGFPLTLQNSTVAFNNGQYLGNGGLYLLDATLLESTIVSNNTGAATYDPNITGTGTISGANNLVTSSDLPLPGDTIATDPNLQPLANNGGSTQTHALLAGSSAIDKGNNLAGLATDQRGTSYARSSGAAPDIGAFELQAPRVQTVAQPVPALTSWVLGLLAAMLGLLGWQREQRQRRLH